MQQQLAKKRHEVLTYTFGGGVVYRRAIPLSLPSSGNPPSTDNCTTGWIRTQGETFMYLSSITIIFHYFPCSLLLFIICCSSILNDHGLVQIPAASAFFFFLNYHNIPKCLTINVPQETEISIHFNFPGKFERGGGGNL